MNNRAWTLQGSNGMDVWRKPYSVVLPYILRRRNEVIHNVTKVYMSIQFYDLAFAIYINLLEERWIQCVRCCFGYLVGLHDWGGMLDRGWLGDELIWLGENWWRWVFWLQGKVLWRLEGVVKWRRRKVLKFWGLVMELLAGVCPSWGGVQSHCSLRFWSINLLL